MNIQEAKAILIEYNAWRKGDETNLSVSGTEVGFAIDCAIKNLDSKFMFESVRDYKESLGYNVNDAFKLGFNASRWRLS